MKPVFHLIQNHIKSYVWYKSYDQISNLVLDQSLDQTWEQMRPPIRQVKNSVHNGLNELDETSL